MSLVINDIYTSISGEVGIDTIKQGDYLTIIRLQGCNLRCVWCDSPDALETEDGIRVDVDSLYKKIKTKKVMITGGEPLLQKKGLFNLLKLCYDDKEVQVETNGSIPLFASDLFIKKIGWIIDYKCPSSGVNYKMPSPEYFMAAWNAYPKKIIKFVVADQVDLAYAWATMKGMLKVACSLKNLQFGISPVDAEKGGIQKAITFFEEKDPWLLDHITFSLQLHKIVEMK